MTQQRRSPAHPWEVIPQFFGLRPTIPSADMTAPQRPNETNIGYGTRNWLGQMQSGLSNVWNAPGAALYGGVSDLVNYALSTPQQDQRRQNLGTAGQRNAGPVPGAPAIAQQAQRQAAQPPQPQQPFRQGTGGFNIQAAANFGERFGRVTNTVRGPGDYERLRAAGYEPARNSLHNHGLAIDIVPRQGMSHEQLLAEYERAGFPVDRSKSYRDSKRGHSHIAFLGEGNPGGGAGGLNLPNAPGAGALNQGYGQAFAELERAAQLAKQPFTTELNMQPPPERPAPTPFEQVDFTAGDEAFEKTRPKNPFEDAQAKVKVQREGYFGGMAKALASMDFSRGFGVAELFAKLGAGALAGRLAGDDYIRQREEKFDLEMRQFYAALSDRNDKKALEHARTAQLNVNQMNQHNAQVFGDNWNLWQMFLPQVGPQGVSSFGGFENGVPSTFTHRPNPQAIDVAFAERKAGMYMGWGQGLQGYNQWQAQFDFQRGTTLYNYAIQERLMQGQPQQATDMIATQLARVVVPAVEGGSIRRIIGADTYNQMEDRAMQELFGMSRKDLLARQPNGLMPSDAQEQLQRFISEQLIREAFLDPTGNLANRLIMESGSASTPSGAAAGAVGRVQSERRSERTDNRGRTSSSTTYRN